MNKVELVGRLTKDPEIRLTANQTQFCQFTIAVDRKFKDANGQRQADFINCLAWKNTAVFIQNYFKKGNRIGLVGNIQTRNYEDQNGQKHFITEVVVDEAEFVESQNTSQVQNSAPVPEPSEPQAPVVSQNVAPVAPTAPVQQTQVVDDEVPGELPFEI